MSEPVQPVTPEEATAAVPESVKVTEVQSSTPAGAVVETTTAKTEAGGAPRVWNVLRSPTAMWLYTLVPLVSWFLAGFDVGKFYDLMDKNWVAIFTICASGIGLKKGTELASTALLKNKGAAGSVTP